MQSFPLLRRIGEVVDGRERGWAELMYIESQAMVGTMLQLKARKTPSLAVHDSIIVPLSERVYAMYLLEHWYHRFTSVWPILVPHFPEGHEEEVEDRRSRIRIVNSPDPKEQAYSADDPTNPLNF